VNVRDTLPPRCRHLRWKSFAFGDDDGDDPIALAESLLKRQVPFSCLRTCQAWGPDDDLVSPEDCTPVRACFVPVPIPPPPGPATDR
jgi:hypothetical protein